MATNIHFSSYLAQLYLEWEMFQKKVVDKSKHTFDINTFAASYLNTQGLNNSGLKSRQRRP